MVERNDRNDVQIHRFPQYKYVDAARWIPRVSAFDRHMVLALHDSDSDASSIEIHALDHQNPRDLSLVSSSSLNSRISSMKVSKTQHKPFIAVSTFTSSLHFLFFDPIESVFESELSIEDREFHNGMISAVDISESGFDSVTVGEDGRVNVVNVGEKGLGFDRVFDSRGLASYTAVRWGSPMEFSTGGLGFNVQWWDRRKPGGAVSQFKGGRTQGVTTGIVHSIDIHPSRKHTCMVGGTSGCVFAWDLRWPQESIILSGIGLNEPNHISCESEVWEVQYDGFHQSTNHSASSSKVLPAMICSEDGILAILEQGVEPSELLAEPWAINSLDIDPQNPSNVLCSLESEAIAVLMRS